MKNLKKSAIVLLTVLVALAAFASKSSAITKGELKDYVLSSKGVAESGITMTDADKAKVEKLFKNNEITDEQAAKLKSKLEAAVAILVQDGAKRPSELSSKELKQNVLGLAEEAAAVLGYTISYDASEDRLDLYKGGKLVESFNWGSNPTSGNGTTEPSLVQTGSSNFGYIAIAGVVLIAGAAFVVARKNAAK